jgi:dihydrofolate reductase
MIKLIAAIGLNGELGFENKLLCHLPNDLNRFKELTTNSTVVMGSNTYRSIGKLLPNRANVILSSNPHFKVPGAIVMHSAEEVLRHYYSYFVKSDLYIIGGQTLYEQFLDYADEVELTIINNKFDQADVFFPKLGDDWKLKQNIKKYADDKHQYDYTFCTYTRKNLSKS